jgi:multidrug resistance efflux pump
VQATSTLAPASKPSVRRFLPVVAVILGLATYGGYRAYDARRPYEWSGTVEGRTISVGSRAGGRVKEILVREGEEVKAGQPLLTLEIGDFEAQRLQAQAAVDEAQATLDKLQAGARPEEIEEAKARASTASAALDEARHGARREQVQAAEARLVASQVTLDKAQLDVDRARKLLVTGAVSQSEADAAESQLHGATALRDAAKKTLEELQNGSRNEEIAQASARADEAKASARLVVAVTRVEDLKVAAANVLAARGKLDQINVLIDELVIRASRPSRVEALDLRPGDILAPNATAATLLEADELYVRIYVPETRLGRIHVGDHVPVTVDSFADKAFQGVVEHINDVGEYSPRNLQTADERADQVFAARIGLHEGRGELRAGMAAFITVPK